MLTDEEFDDKLNELTFGTDTQTDRERGKAARLLLLADHAELQQQLAEARERAEKSEAACVALRAALESVDGDCCYAREYICIDEHDADCLVGEALATPAPGAALLADARAVTAALLEAEWVGEELFCPWCYNYRDMGHAETCLRQHVLERARARGWDKPGERPDTTT